MTTLEANTPKIRESTKTQITEGIQKLAKSKAKAADFTSQGAEMTTAPPADLSSGQYFVVEDATLRAKILSAEMGEVLQRPRLGQPKKGETRAKWILKYYPDGGAPKAEVKPRKSKTDEAGATPPAPNVSVSLDDAYKVFETVKRREDEFAESSLKINNQETDRIIREIADLSAKDSDSPKLNELRNDLETHYGQRPGIRKTARRTAFARVQDDETVKGREILQFVTKD